MHDISEKAVKAMPERIFLGCADTDNEHQVWTDEGEGGTEYVRADLAAPHLAAVRVTGGDLVECVARAWASIDGKSDLFDECKFSQFMEDQNGTYEGYMAEARELIERAALEPSAGRAAALEEAARLCDQSSAISKEQQDKEQNPFIRNALMGERATANMLAKRIRALASHPVADKPDEAEAQGEGWLPIDEAAKSGRIVRIAYNRDDVTMADAFYRDGKWHAACVFYRSGVGKPPYEFREHKVLESLVFAYCPLPSAPASEGGSNV